jgi:APA family basic amino acid/polyamine antiporter
MPPSRTLSVVDAVAMLIGIVIGIGIFKAPALVAQNVTSEEAFLALWLLGGFIALAGALCYAELGSAHPHSGGEYHFLAQAYGRRAGIMFGWARGSVIQTGAIAAVTFVYGDYANGLIPLGSYGPAIHAVIALCAMTGLNLVGTLQSKRSQVVFTFLTVGAILAVIIGGLSLTAAPETAAAAGTGTATTAIGFAMVFVLLTYGGWNEAAYLSGELRDVGRNMVRVLLIGVAVITSIYLAINYAYLHVFGLEGLRASSAIGEDLMRRVGGDWAAVLMGLIICAAALSTLNATIFTGARTYYALGNDLPVLRSLGLWSDRGDNPVNALLLQSAIALVLILFGSMARDGFEAMIAYTAPVFWFFLLLVGGAVFVFRYREPDRARPFRVPLYPLTPAVFCATSAWMLYSSLAYAGPGALIGVLVVLAGIPLLWIAPRESVAVKTTEAGEPTITSP